MERHEHLKTIMDRERLSTTPRCPACGMNFTLGETVVVACGDWGGQPKLIHEADAVFDSATGSFFERECYRTRRNG